MKRIIIAFAIFICASSITLFASDLSEAKRNLKSAQKELSSVTSKRNKAQQKQEQLQADYEQTLAKVTANQEKPKSIAYKDAVKKSETLFARLEQNALLLTVLNRQVDSLQNLVSECESALSQVQKEDVETERKKPSTKETAVEPVVTPAIEQPVEKEGKRDATVLSNNSKSKEASSSEDKATSSSKPTTFLGKVWKVIKTIFWIIIGIIVLVFFVKIGGSGSSSHSSSSRSSSSSSTSSNSSSRSDDKKRRIANLQAEIARQQGKIASLKASINSRKRDRMPYRDLQHSIEVCQERIANYKREIALIKAR